VAILSSPIRVDLITMIMASIDALIGVAFLCGMAHHAGRLTGWPLALHPPRVHVGTSITAYAACHRRIARQGETSRSICSDYRVLASYGISRLPPKTDPVDPG